MRVSDIVRKYSEIAKPEEQSAVETNANDIIESIVGLFRGGYESVSFETKLDKAMPSITVVPEHFKQVIVNIVKNAVEAIQDSKKAKVVISSCGFINLGGKQFIEIQISDNGPGISAPIRSKLFQPYNTSKKNAGHSGLGLSIVRSLVVQMGGLISCKSLVNEEGTPGSQFQILIPSNDSQ